MPQRIKLRNSVVEGQKPDPADLAIGEVCVGAHPNTPGLIFKDSADNIIELSPVSEGLWEEDGNAVTPIKDGADLTIEGSVTAAGTVTAGNFDIEALPELPA